MSTAFKQLKNNAKTTVYTNALNNTTVTLSFDVRNGDVFPTPGSGFYVTTWNKGRYSDPGDDPNMRIGLCTARSGNTLTVTWGQLGTQVNAVIGTLTIALLVIDENVQDAYDAINDIEDVIVNKQDELCVTVGETSSQYPTDGHEDDVQLQAALTDVHNSGGGIVEVTSPLNIKRMITLYAGVVLLCHGDSTPLKITSDFLNGVALRENTGLADNLTLLRVTVDLSGKADVGGIHIYQGDYVTLIEPHITGQSYSVSSKWALRIGNYTSGSPVGTASHGMRLIRPRIENCDCGTFEQILIVNQQDYFIDNPYFESNTNRLAYELTCYINNKNGVILAPHFETPSANSIAVQESDGIQFFGVSANYTSDYKLVTIINSQNVLFDGLIANNTVANSANTVIDIFDRTVGPDGFTQLIADSNNVIFSNVMTDGWKYLVTSQLGGTVSGTSYNMNQYNFQFNNVLAKNLVSLPFLIGIDNVANTLHNWDFNNVKILSWGGTSAGAFQLRGYSSGVTQMYGFRLNNVKVPPSSGVGSSAAVRAIGMQVDSIKNSDFSGTFTTFGAISLVTSGTVNEVIDTLGVNPNREYDQGNITGATSFLRSSGEFITATATGNVTTTVPAGQRGDILTLKIAQDATGSRTISKPANVKLVGGVFSPTATANAIDSWTLQYDGTYWNEVSRALNIS